MAKPGIIQLSEFDITQKIIESLSNVCTRAVLFSIKFESKDATQIADLLKISISTVYKTLCILEDLALIEVEQFVPGSYMFMYNDLDNNSLTYKREKYHNIIIYNTFKINEILTITRLRLITNLLRVNFFLGPSKSESSN